MTPAPTTAPSAPTSPKLRPDLQWIAEAGGALIYDPVAHRFARLDEVSSTLFALWHKSGAGAAAPLPVAATSAHVERFVEFARRNGWLVPESDAEIRAVAGVAAQAEKRDWRWLLHSYISFRLPLIAPESLLDRLAPLLNILFSRVAMIITGLAAVVAVYLASRQWAELTAAAHGLMSPSAIALMGLTLLIVKVWHEIGHGHMARRYGCRVPSAGVLVIVGAPLFYTDVTDAWRLQERRERMMIAAAGVAAESMLAVAALMLWVFLPDGILRSLCFFVATGSLITSLFVNLSPFMRFDGYFIVSDGLRISNLHAKAFAAMNWLLRRSLLGLDDPRPQEIVGLRAGWLAAFGVATAIYRLTLFIGIAVLVYHVTFKILGIVLFAAEIIWFVVRPVWNEVKIWRARRADIRWRGRALATMACIILLLIAFVAPLSTSVRMKAVIEAGAQAPLYSPAAATVVAVHRQPGDTVQKGEPVITLVSPQLRHQLALTETRLALVNARLARGAGDAQERTLTQVLLMEKSSLEVQRSGYAAEIEGLVLRAPFYGRIMEIDRDIKPDSIVSPKLRLALISGEQGLSARAYANAEAASRLKAPAQAWFVPEDASAARLPLTLARIGVAATQLVEPMALAESFGGDVPTVPDRSGRPSASAAAFLLTFAGAGSPPPLALRGSIHVEAAPESLAARAFRRAASVLIRESGV